MDIFNQLIDSLSKEEIQAFKLYALRKNANMERKDLLLFDFAKKQQEKYNEDDISGKLYPNQGKNAFYRLKNRLTENILKSLSVHHFSTSDTNNIHHLLGLVQLFNQKGTSKLALHYLKKSEKNAIASENFEMLDIIYSEFIKISREFLSVNPEVYMKIRQDNYEKLSKLRELDNALAVINYKLKTTQNFTSKKNEIIPLLETTIGKLVKDNDVLSSIKFRTKIYRAVSQVLLSKREYVALEKYLLQTFKDFETLRLFSEKNHDTKLQMATYITNSLFKNDKIKESLKWAAKLNEFMDEYKAVLKSKYQIFYFNALVNNYNVIDKNKSIQILEEIRVGKWMETNPFLGIFVYINLALNWFDKFEYKKSIKNFQQLQLLDQYKNTGVSLRFKWSIGELIVRYQLQDSEFLSFRIKQVQREFKDVLNEQSNYRDKQLIEILKMINGKKKFKYATKEFVKNFINQPGNDGELINYGNWLKSLRILDEN